MIILSQYPGSTTSMCGYIKVTVSSNARGSHLQVVTNTHFQSVRLVLHLTANKKPNRLPEFGINDVLKLNETHIHIHILHTYIDTQALAVVGLPKTTQKNNKTKSKI